MQGVTRNEDRIVKETRIIVTCCLLLAVAAAGFTAMPTYPGYNRLVIPKTAKTVTPDGVITPEEWDGAAVVTGLYRYGPEKDLLPKEQQTWFYLTYDDKNLYVAMRSTNYPVGSRLKSDTKNERDPEYIVLYDHFETQFCRTSDPVSALRKHFYKFVGNHRDSFLDQKAQPSVGQWGLEWDGGAKYANKVSRDCWDMEMAIPWANMDEKVGPRELETWLMWLVRAYNGQSSDFFMWGGRDWLTWDQIPRVTFSSALPVARLEQLGEPLEGKLDAVVMLINPSPAEHAVHVNLTIQSKDTDVFQYDKTFEVKRGERVAVPIRKLDLPMPEKGTLLTISAWVDQTDESGATYPIVIYQQKAALVPKDAQYQDYHLRHVKDYREKTLDYTWKVAYYHSKGSVHGTLSLDIDGLDPKYAKATKWRVRIVNSKTKAAGFDRAVPIADLTAELDAEKVGRLGQGEWQVQSILLDKAGKPLDTKQYVLTVAAQPWEGCKAGLDDSFVPPPYTPIAVEANKLNVLNRTYTLADTGLPSSITSEGHELLASPIRIEAVSGGKKLTAEGQGIVWGEMKPGKIWWTSRAALGDLTLILKCRMEYDGTMFVDLTCDPKGKQLAFESIDYVTDMAGLVNVAKPFRGSNYASAGSFMIPAEQKGIIWESASSRPVTNLIGSFNPLLYLGNPDRGLWWMADSDQGWVLDDAKSATTIERLADGAVRMNQWFVNTPTVLKQPFTISFLVQAAPAKPLPSGWREIAWGPQIVYGGATWSDGYYTFSYDTPEQWKEYAKWEYANRPVYTATNVYGQAVPGFQTYAGEWREKGGDSNTSNLTVNPQIESLFPDKVYKSAAGISVPGDFERRVGEYEDLCDMAPSLIDCRLYCYEQGVKYAKLPGYWWDMDSLWCSHKSELGFGYVRSNGKRQGGFNYTAMRDMFKRMYNTAYMNGVVPRHWHYPDGYYGAFLEGAWMIEGAYFMFNKDVDLIGGAPRDLWPVVGGRHTSCIPQMCTNFYSIDSLYLPLADPAPTRAALTLCFLNDFGGYGMNDFYRNQILAKLRKEGFFDPNVRSIRHWEPELAQLATYSPENAKSDVLVTCYTLPEWKLLVVLGNMSEKGTHGALSLRPSELLGGADCRNLKAIDIESGIEVRGNSTGGSKEELKLEKLWVGGHDFRLFIVSK
jgi:hypothetical protein